MTILKWLKKFVIYDDRPSGALRRAYFKCVVFWNPVICPTLAIFLSGFEHIGRRIVITFLISTIVTHICFGACGLAWLIGWVRQRYFGVAPRAHSRGWWMSVSMVAMPLGLYLAFKIMAVLTPILHLPQEAATSTPDDYRVGILIGTMIAGIFFLLQTRAEAKERARQTEMKVKELENERLQAQISALTAQMNPHLMFNALNTVASLVPTDPVKAEETIVKLSELYRGVLNSSRRMTHSLATELQICEAYLSVEKARFGERLKAAIEVDPAVQPERMEIPALCIQPLVENAIKHGLSSRAAGGSVVIRAGAADGRLTIAVEDDGIGFQQAARSPVKKAGTGTGLKNCKERLALHYGVESDFQICERPEGGARVEMTMPARMVP